MADEYASHLPVLKAVMALLKPKEVLELGAGLHSTPFFLTCPIKRLVSVETDPEWAIKVTKECPDSRLSIRTSLDNLTPLSFDLVFIDNGTTKAEREKAIRWGLEGAHPPTIVHDAEVYATLLSELAPDYVSIPTIPATAVIA